LDLTEEYNLNTGRVSCPWEEMDRYLCPLAQRFKDAHPGKEMKVKILGGYPNWVKDDGQGEINFRDGRFLPNLMKEAAVWKNFM